MIEQMYEENPMRLSEAIEAYYLACRVNNISQKSMISYQSNVNSFLNVVGDMPVNELTPNHVRIYIAHEMERISPNTGKHLSSESVAKPMRLSGPSVAGFMIRR